MGRKRKREDDGQTKESKLQKKIDAGTWNQFLRMDAIITRKAFIHWYHNIYLTSARGKELSKGAKNEIHSLISKLPPNSVNPAELLPKTLQVISTWENMPMPFASNQWLIARVRLIADLLLSGTFIELQGHSELAAATAKEIKEARSWIYQQPNGDLMRYQSLAQPWCTKEVPWPYDNTHIKLASPSSALTFLPSAWTVANMDDVRISPEKFKQLVRANNSGFWPDNYEDGGSIATNHLDLEWTNDQFEGLEGNGQNNDPGEAWIHDWLELVIHSTNERANRGWADGDQPERITTDGDFNETGSEDLQGIEPASSALLPLPTSSIRWTAINDLPGA
ncbi:MAG: hypothetical protein Q9204_008260 [Flavoplaca sp. TL-2023a]